MSLIFYEPTKEVDEIISPMIEKFKHSAPEYADKAVMPATYNTPTNPLFKVTDIAILLGKTNLKKVLLEDQKKPKDERFYSEGKDFVHGLARNARGSKRKALFFTRRGFYIYLMTSRGDISNLFRNFLIVVLEELHEKGMVKQEDAIRITTEKYQDEIKRIENRLSKVNLVLEKEQLLRIETEKHLEETEIDRDTLKIISEYHKKKVQEAREYQENMIDDFPTDKEDELRIMKMKYMKPVKIYLIPFEKVQRAIKKPKKRKKNPKGKIYEYLTVAQVKELGLEESDSDSDLEEKSFVIEYDYSLFGAINPPHKSDDYYYTISQSKKLSNRLGIHVGDVYVTGKDHFEVIVKYLQEHCSTPLRGAFLTSIGEIEEKAREIFISQNKNMVTTVPYTEVTKSNQRAYSG